jgi:serine protease inhibitor
MRALLLVLLSTITGQAQTPPQAQAMDGPAASNAHAFELFQLFRPMTAGNFCFSPFSSHQVAALLAAAAGGETQAELAALTHLGGDVTKDLEKAGALRSTVVRTASEGALTLEITHSLWAPGTVSFAPAFLESARTHFDADLQKLPAGNATACAAAVNLRGREKSHGRFAQLVGPASFPDPSHAVVVVNTVYLKGSWVHPFDFKLTKRRAFQTSTQGALMLPTMLMPLGAFDYTEAESYQCLEMSMVGGGVSLTILLPRDEPSRQKIETSLTPEIWAAVCRGLSPYDANVQLPRFGYSTQLSLKGLWQTLGARRLFEKGLADLSKGMPGSDFFISDISHEAMIEINELGAKAAAATTAAAEPFGEAPDKFKRRKINFIANHPFIWMLRHQPTGTILLMGRFAGA